MYYLKKLEGSGATHKDSSILNNVSQDMLKRIQTTIPDPTVLKHFHETISPVFGGIISAQQAITEIMCLRDSLLPLLMNGQVEVK